MISCGFQDVSPFIISTHQPLTRSINLRRTIANEGELELVFVFGLVSPAGASLASGSGVLFGNFPGLNGGCRIAAQRLRGGAKEAIRVLQAMGSQPFEIAAEQQSEVMQFLTQAFNAGDSGRKARQGFGSQLILLKIPQDEAELLCKAGQTRTGAK